MNRLEEKLGRECTDFDFDAQQELLDATRVEIKRLKHIIWAIAREAPNHSVSYFEGLLNTPPEQCDLVWENSVMDMMITVRAELRTGTSNTDTVKS